MKILVTGGAGFIGSHLAGALLGAGHEVRVLDDFSSGDARNLRDLQGEVEVHEGDCAEPRAAARAVRGVEVVYHQAAVPSVTRSVLDPPESHRINATATLVMLEAARKARVRRFVYAGSSAVYGDLPGLPKRETSPVRPMSPYAVGKLMGEHYVRVYSELYGLQALTLRYFNIFGPRQDAASPYSGVISLFLRALVEGKRPVVYGTGEQTRDFTYVGNVVDANLRALSARPAVGQAVNVATGRRTSLNQLLNALAGATGRHPRPVHRPPRAGDILHSVADVSLARRLLGYRPAYDLVTGLRETVCFYRDGVAGPWAAPAGRARR
jgi:nucleoside-diphosphate-sugar epimerase